MGSGAKGVAEQTDLGAVASLYGTIRVDMPGALNDLRVIELAQGWAGPLCGRLLSELGADVIKVEPPNGDWLRAVGPTIDGISYAFHLTSANKRSVVLDLEATNERQRFLNLVGSADILIDDTPLGYLPRLGLDSGTLRKANPQLIHSSITPFGRTGPLANWRGSELVLQATSGVMATTGFPEDEPTRTGPLIGQHLGALYAGTASLAALLYRERTGRGQAIDVSIHDCLIAGMYNFLPSYFHTGELPRRMGNRQATVVTFNVFQARDGWVVIAATTDGQWQQLLRALGRGDLVGDQRYDTRGKRFERRLEVEQIITEQTSQRTVAEVVEALERYRVAAGPIPNLDQVIQDPHFQHRNLLVWLDNPSGKPIPTIGSPFKFSETPGLVRSPAPRLGAHTDEVLRSLPKRRESERPRATKPAAPDALEGLRVIEAAFYTAGPLGGRLLANLGAEVIKVEPPSGEPTRTQIPLIAGQSYIFNFTNNSKKSITLDLSKPEGRDLFKALARHADVVLENFSTGVMERLGLGYEALREINPGLVYCSLNGFGQTGPYATKMAYDPVIQGIAGIMGITGQPHRPPTRTGLSSGDFTGGSFSPVAILAALYHRWRTGKGQYLDLAMYDVAVWLTQNVWPTYFATGTPPPRVGNRHLHIAPHNLYQAKDGFVALAIETDLQWRALAGLIGGEQLATAPLYATMAQRAQAVEEVDQLVADWTRERTRDEVVSACQQADVPCGPFLEGHEAAGHPHTLEREMVVIREHPVQGPLKLLGSPYKMSETPGRIYGPAPPLGQHNEEILGRLLGYDTQELERLKRDGVI